MIKKMKLKDVGTIITGNTPSKKNEEYYNSNDINFFTPTDFKDGRINKFKESVNYISNNAKGKARILPEGSVLVTCIGIIGKVGIIEQESAFNQQINAVIPNKDIIDNRYLAYWLISKADVLRKKANAPVVPIINKTDFQELEIDVPNIEAQKEIVNKLNKIQKLIDIKEEQKCLYEDLIKAQFVEMFGDPNINNKKFKKVNLKNCLINIDNGKSFVCESFPRKNEYPAILKLSAVTYGYYDQDENKALIDEDMYIPSVVVKQGDLLFTRKNTPELVGMSAYVYNTKPNLMLPDLIFRLNTTDICNKVYLWKLINHKTFRKNITQISNGSAKSMSNISKANLMNLEIILPPIELQNEFARLVEKVERQKEQVKRNLEEIKTLKNEVMNKYFN